MKYLFLKLAAAAALMLALACGGDNDAPLPQPNTAVAAVAIQGKVPRMMVGDKLTLNAMVMPAGATNKGVSWASSDTHVATVSGSGVGATVTALGAGEVEITVRTSEGGFTDTFRMIVSDGSVAVAGLSLDRTALSLVPGGSAVLVASLWPSDATDQGVAWVSNNESCATVKGSGTNAMVTAVANGSAVITARTNNGGFTATCTVTVAPYTVPLTGIALNRTSLDIPLRTTGSITATLQPSNASASITWATGDTGVATLTGSGASTTVRGAGAGFTDITATAGNFSATCAVRVYPIPATGITLQRTAMDVPIRGGSVTLSATLQPSNTTDEVTWATSAPSVVALSGSGASATLTPVANGNATITVTVGDVTATCAVRVLDKPKTVPMQAHKPISFGWYHAVAIKADGSLWAWGYNNCGQLGLGDHTNRSVPTRVGTDTNWVSVAAGADHTLAIKTDGSLWAWGYNAAGGCGLGDDRTDRIVPERVGTDTGWAAASVGSSCSAAIKTDGSLWVWGPGGSSGLGDLNATWRTPTRLGTGNDWAAVSCGQSHMLALKDYGAIYGWGSNPDGRLGNGTVANDYPVLIPIQSGTDEDWVAVSSGDFHTLAIKGDGSLWGSGVNRQGQLGTGNGTDRLVFTRGGTDTDWTAALPGSYHTLAVKGDGSLWGCGNNQEGQLGLGSDLVVTATHRQIIAADMGRVVAIAAGSWFSGAIKSNGELWIWGENNRGQLGFGDTTNRYSPVLLGTGFRVPTN